MVLRKLFICGFFAMGMISTIFAGNSNSIFIKKSNENGVNDKLFDFFRVLNSASKAKNIVISPYSILTAAAMLERGTGGESKEQLDKAFGIDKLCKGYFASYLIRWKSHSMLSMSNSIWMDSKYSISSSYRIALNKEFNADVFSLNFSSKPKQKARQINLYASKYTNGLITKVIEPTSIHLNTTMLLLNTIYFKGKWEFPFQKDLTRKGFFYTETKRKLKVDIMNDTSFRSYFQNEMVSGIELPYSGGGFSMMLLLPSKPGKVALNQVIEKLSQKNISMWLKSIKKGQVALSMPKCKIRCRTDLNDVYKKLGVTDIFSHEKADLLPMLSSKEISPYVNRILQETAVIINEEGTEAAGVDLEETFSKDLPLRFNVNRPYLFLIRDRVTENILFIGKITNPL